MIIQNEERKELSEKELEKVSGGVIVKQTIKEFVSVPVRDDGVAFCPHCIVQFHVGENSVYTCPTCGRQYESFYWSTSMTTQWNEITFVEKEESQPEESQNPSHSINPLQPHLEPAVRIR